MITALVMAAAALTAGDGGAATTSRDVIAARYATGKIVCKAEAAVSGAAIRVCLTPRDWERRRLDNQQNLRLIQTRAYLIRR